MDLSIFFLLAALGRSCYGNSVEGWTEYVRVNMLQEVLENQYLRTPIALVLDLNSNTVQHFTSLWRETAEQGLPDREVMFFPVAGRDIAPAKQYNAEQLSGMLYELRPASDASLEEQGEGGPVITAALAATAKLPYDSAVMIVTGKTPNDSGMEETMAQMLIRKRARLYVIWTGKQNGEEDRLREVALLTGGALYYMETNAVIRTRMLRIENADLDQTIISRSDVIGRLESSFTVPAGDPGFRIRLIGNLSLASLIDPQGHTRDLLEVLGDEESDIVVTTEGQPLGTWLLITDSVDNNAYDLKVLKKYQETTEPSSTDSLLDDAEDIQPEISSARLRRSAQKNDTMARMTFPDGTSHKNETLAKRIVTPVLGQQRSLVSEPVIIQLSSGTNLEVRPGTTTTLQFEVTNDRYIDTPVSFLATGQGVYVQNVQPQQALLSPSNPTRVQVTVASQTTGTGTLKFAVSGAGWIRSLSAYITFTTISTTDDWDPKIDYRYMGDCRQFNTPATCYNGQWSLETTIRDDETGLLKVMSEPFGLIFGTEFFAGTKSVTARYMATCCKPRVDIWAEDLRGHYKRKSFDVFHQGLLDGEIASVVLAVLLLIALILLIIMTILFCRKRKTDTIILPRHRAGSR